MAERLLVVGGDAAGMSAASQARRRRAADDLEIVAFERGNDTSYSACGIPYWVAGLVEDREDLIARSPEEFRERQQIQVHLRSEVVAVDVDRRTVEVWDHDAGTARHEGWDHLLLATGAAPIRPPLPGLDVGGVFGVQTLDEGAAVHAFIDEHDVRRAVVVGGGYIGLEMAEAMVERGIEVHLLQRSAHLMPTLDAEMGELVAEALRALGVHVHLERPATSFEAGPDGNVVAVGTPDGDLPADLVFLGLGTRPRADLAVEAGIPVGHTGGILTDACQRTSIEGVWAAGDCAETFHRVARRGVAIALGTIANKQGRVAGINLGGEPATFPGVLGTAITRVLDTEIARTGLTSWEAAEIGQPCDVVTIESTTTAGYFPGASPMQVRMTFDPSDGRVLGAQIVGGPGAGKRIDTVATALWNEMTAGELLNVDLAYAPPFSGVWDPVLVAARKAWQATR